MAESGGGGVERAALSFIATTIPVDDERVFRGLPNAEALKAIFSGAAAGVTAWETAGNMLPSAAGLRR